MANIQENSSTNNTVETREAEPQIYLYEHRDFKGRSQQFSAYGLRSEEITELAYQVSSIEMPSGVTLELQDSQSGLSVEFTESVAYVGDDINDSADIIFITMPLCPPASDGDAVC
jgi:hypothetical protein